MMTRKEPVVAYSKYNPDICLEELKEARIWYVVINSLLAVISDLHVGVIIG
jgi:hypothetical protein